MLLSTICTLKMCNIFHFQIQSNIETLPLSLSSLTSPASEVRQGGKKDNTPQPPPPSYLKFRDLLKANKIPQVYKTDWTALADPASAETLDKLDYLISRVPSNLNNSMIL